MGRPGAQVTLLRLHLHPTPQPGRQDHSFSSCQTHQSQTPTCFHGNEAATPLSVPTAPGGGARSQQGLGLSSHFLRVGPG